ncbi:MAG: hypothetical protein K2L10_00040 [Ruminococcus sp.]|nr:hypothetical protein [Ruminococcus sp.]
MKKLSTYLVSLVIAVVLVFMMIATALIVVVRTNVTAEKSIHLSEDMNIYSSIKGELEKYFSGQYNTTGIPADIYMNAFDENYIRTVTDSYTNALFTSLQSGRKTSTEIPQNENFETNIKNFFSEYADSNGYEKDEVYDKKVSATIDNAYKVIENYCDIYKYSTLQEHGVVSKVSRIYNSLGKLMTVCIGVSVFLVVILILVNIKGISGVLYWTGVSALIAGLFGTVPCAYLLGTNYFDSFVIKQAQVFRTFTGAMYGLTGVFMRASIGLLVIGILFIVSYAVINRRSKKSE